MGPTIVLGMHFTQSVAIIQSQVGVIKGVQVLYNDKVSSSFIHYDNLLNNCDF